jgi:hypothetical protein
MKQSSTDNGHSNTDLGKTLSNLIRLKKKSSMVITNNNLQTLIYFKTLFSFKS